MARIHRFGFRRRVGFAAPLLLAFAAALGSGFQSQARAQAWGIYGGSPIFGYGGGMYPWSLAPMSWGVADFGVIDFGVMNWFPGGYFNIYNPYWAYQQVAQADYLAMADAGLTQASFNVQSLQAGSIADANSLISDNLAMFQALDNMSKPNHSDRFNIQTGRPWSAGRSSAPRLADAVANDGNVLWPLNAPNDQYLRDKRAAANTAIKNVVADFRRTGRANVDKTSLALKNLQAYAQPGVDTMRREGAPGVNGFIEFVRNLDGSLRNLVGEVNVNDVPRPRLDPPRTPNPPAPGRRPASGG